MVGPAERVRQVGIGTGRRVHEVGLQMGVGRRIRSMVEHVKRRVRRIMRRGRIEPTAPLFPPERHAPPAT